MVGRGEIDFASTFAATVVYHLDAGVPVTVLSGLHSGCFELFAHGPIQSIGDLKGRKVGIQSLSSSAHLYMAIMAAQVGLDPGEDLDWVVPPEEGHGTVRCGKSRRLSGLSARAAGAARA
jgi:NitT/TauT family transport system substrate-binding protein